ncbi:MAG: FitA-like ribbon-helix-helix domain-containing protein [Candidatus Eiseniibacteriota bacterium]
MGQVLVRNIADAVIDRLKARAARHGRSLEAELRTVLEQAAVADRSTFIETADRIRKELEGRWTGDSTQLIREDRDR